MQLLQPISLAIALYLFGTSCEAFNFHGGFYKQAARNQQLRAVQAPTKGSSSLSSMRKDMFQSSCLKNPRGGSCFPPNQQGIRLKPLLLSPSRSAQGQHEDDDEAESLLDPSSAEVRVLNARLKGEFHLPRWGRAFRLRGKETDASSFSAADMEQQEEEDVITLREYRANFLPKAYMQACFNMTKINMEYMYDYSSWGWNDMKKRRSLEHESARFVVATKRSNAASQDVQVVGFVHYR
jgi:hypothetical protein